MTVQAAASRFDAKTYPYCKFRILAPSGSLAIFYFAGSAFGTATFFTGQRTYPVVSSFGTFTKSSIAGGRSNIGTALITVLGNEVCVGGDTVRYTFLQLLRESRFREASFDVYLGNYEDGASELMWTGFFDSIESIKTINGQQYVTVKLVDRTKAMDNFISDVVTLNSMGQAMRSANGQMIPRVYGALGITGVNYKQEAALLGYPIPAVQGTVVDEQVDSGKMKVRFCKNDGSFGAVQFDLAKSGGNPTSDPGVDTSFFIYYSGTGTYGVINSLDIDNPVTNDSAESSINIVKGFRAYVPMRPSEIGPNNQVTADIQAVMNDDPSDFAVTTTTLQRMSYYCPQFPVLGTILDVRLAVRCENTNASTRTIRFGLVRTSTGTYVNTLYYETILPATSGQLFLITANSLGTPNGYWDETLTFDSWGTGGDFKNGRLFEYDSVTKARIPCQMRFEVTNGSPNCNGVRLYDFTLIWHVRVPSTQIQDLKMLPKWLTSSFAMQEYFKQNGWTMGGFKPNALWDKLRHDPKNWITLSIADQGGRSTHPEIVACMEGQKDDGSGTYSGTANARIERATDVAYHLIKKIHGDNVNVTANSLGSFVDARTAYPAGSIVIQGALGGKPLTFSDSLELLSGRFGLKFYQVGGVWQVITPDYAPAAGRVYRSTNETIWIDPQEDIIGFELSETDFADVENNITVNCGSGPSASNPVAWANYRNRVSEFYYGQMAEIPREEPLLPGSGVASGFVDNSEALRLAMLFASMAGRVRGMIKLKLTQKFWDLERGNVVEFSPNMEKFGYNCPLYRCGLFDFQMQSAVKDPDTDNQADDASPAYVDTGVNGGAMYLGMQQRIGEATFNVAVAIGIAGSLTWKFYDPLNNVWNACANVVNGDCLKSTGIQVLQFTMPAIHQWGKGFVFFNGKSVGPCHWLRAEYSGVPSAAGVGSAVSRYPAIYHGRNWEVIDVVRRGGGKGDYPYVECLLMEWI